jgi:hypothetical protein
MPAFFNASIITCISSISFIVGVVIFAIACEISFITIHAFSVLAFQGSNGVLVKLLF